MKYEPLKERIEPLRIVLSAHLERFILFVRYGNLAYVYHFQLAVANNILP